MNKRITSLALAAASIPAALALTAAPASAQESGAACGSYPPGQPFTLRVSPATAAVSRNAVVVLGARLLRGGEACPGQRVGFYLRGRGRSQYVLTQNTNPVTNGQGLRQIRVRVADDFRFFANYSNANTLYARSSTGLVQVRR